MVRERNRKNRERINRRKDEMYCEMVRIRYCTPKVVESLSSKPHPKIESDELTEWNYVDWLLNHGYSTKALAILAPLQTIFNEPYDEHAYGILKREHEDYGVPRTYR